jgi:hypothetical protein
MDDIHIPETEAADPAKFQSAFARASSSGARLIIDPTKPAPPSAEVFGKPEPLHVARSAEPQTYQAAKAKAQAEGRELIIDELPDVPFVAPANAVVIPRSASVEEYRRLRNGAVEKGMSWIVHPTQ